MDPTAPKLPTPSLPCASGAWGTRYVGILDNLPLDPRSVHANAVQPLLLQSPGTIHTARVIPFYGAQALHLVSMPPILSITPISLASLSSLILNEVCIDHLTRGRPGVKMFFTDSFLLCGVYPGAAVARRLRELPCLRFIKILITSNHTVYSGLLCVKFFPYRSCASSNSAISTSPPSCAPRKN